MFVRPPYEGCLLHLRYASMVMTCFSGGDLLNGLTNTDNKATNANSATTTTTTNNNNNDNTTNNDNNDDNDNDNNDYTS